MVPRDAGIRAVAPGWHTLLILALFAIGSIAGAYQHGLPNAHFPGVSDRVSGYLTVLLEEWLAAALIWIALRSRGLTILSLVSGRWSRARDFLRDLAIAIGFTGVVIPLVAVLTYILGGSANEAAASIPPKTAFELMVFLSLAASAGFVEEFVFRGYLTQQFAAWSGSYKIGIILQAVIFGLAHGFYGKVMLAVMLQGLLLGLLARWRKSLRPGMLAHLLQDSLGGVVSFLS
jgi:uncharacterized protein